jgi:sulfate-transporting ATPase
VACDHGGALTYLTDLVHPGAVTLNSPAVAVSDEFDLSAVLDAKPDQISFGRRRLVAIARAVAASPSVLLLDEPAAGLDDAESTELRSVIRSLADDWGMGVLLVEHNTELVLEVCNRVTVLAGGRVLMTGTPEEVRTDERVLAVYLGSRAETGEPESAS